MNECDALRSKVTEMERQEPVAWAATDETCRIVEALSFNQSRRFDTPLGILPGAQPAPSIPDGWLRAIDEALVVAHIGVANESDTYEQAKAKLDTLIGLHVDIATDPAVNGGWKLVPIEPTPTMITAALESSHAINAHRAEHCYRAMLAAAPEAKP
jgi:hypothetical protein